nr:PREDICTED: coiled-coil domain-containing protein 74B isoform X2 [Lepisosteus oculatus]
MCFSSTTRNLKTLGRLKCGCPVAIATFTQKDQELSTGTGAQDAGFISNRTKNNSCAPWTYRRFRRSLPQPRLLPSSPGGMESEPRRVTALERDLQFLQQQHTETLGKLHAEIEQLRRENKDLQYKLIMEPKQSRKGSSTTSSASQSGHRLSQQPSVIASGSSRRGNGQQQADCQEKKGMFIEQAVHKLQLHNTLSEDTFHSGTGSGGENEVACDAAACPEQDLKGGLITSLQPLRILSSPLQPPRAPTLQECEVIIRQLYNANSLQSQELLHLKSVLKDIILNNNKITPETYILTKAYLTGTSRTGETGRFPKLSLKTLPKKMPDAQPSAAERVMLPALKQSLGTSFAERQKRTQAMQKNRLRKVVN